MKKYFALYKPFLLFLGTFFLTYIVLMVLYQLYLNSFGITKIDAITKMVGQHTEQVLRLFDTNAVVQEDKPDDYLKIFYHQKFVAKIIEGCNAISVIILFISFVVAFSGKLKPTLFYILGGSIFIYILNVFRIAVLCVLMNHFPEQQFVLHGVIFPLFIYGAVFILWVIWVNKFSKYAK